MKLIVGLGNPGVKYKKTRHNLGFLAIDNFQLTINKFSNWYFEKKFSSEISQGKINQEKIILAKPQTYMNKSGLAVKFLIENWRPPTRHSLKIAEGSAFISRPRFARAIENLFVIHDDLDLPLGKFKLQKGRGSAGHRGVQSIIDALGTKNFWRLRIGIKSIMNNEQPTMNNIEKFVLEKFNQK